MDSQTNLNVLEEAKIRENLFRFMCGHYNFKAMCSHVLREFMFMQTSISSLHAGDLLRVAPLYE